MRRRHDGTHVYTFVTSSYSRTAGAPAIMAETKVPVKVSVPPCQY